MTVIQLINAYERLRMKALIEAYEEHRMNQTAVRKAESVLASLLPISSERTEIGTQATGVRALIQSLKLIAEDGGVMSGRECQEIALAALESVLP